MLCYSKLDIIIDTVKVTFSQAQIFTKLNVLFYTFFQQNNNYHFVLTFNYQPCVRN